MDLRLFLATLIFICFQATALRAMPPDSHESGQDNKHHSPAPKLQDLSSSVSSQGVPAAGPIGRPSHGEQSGLIAALAGLNLNGDEKPIQPVVAAASSGAAAAAGVAPDAESARLTGDQRSASAAGSSQVVSPLASALSYGSSGALMSFPSETLAYTPMERLSFVPQLPVGAAAGAGAQTAASQSPLLSVAGASGAGALNNDSKPSLLAAAGAGAGTATASYVSLSLSAGAGIEATTSVALTISAAGATGAGASSSSVVSKWNQIAEDDSKDDLKEGIEVIIKRLDETRLTKPVALTRTYTSKTASHRVPLVKYTQSLSVQGRNIACNRGSTRSSMEQVMKVSTLDGNKTHLLAQGMCMGATTTWSFPLSTKLGFPDVPITVDKRMDWVSHKSDAQTNDHYHVRAPQINYMGGHAEPQLISDLEDVFKTNPGKIAELFLPPSDSIQDVYMSGLEIFGPYDMCDAWNGEGNNKYNCVGKLCKFRDDHQSGQQSISVFLRDKLKEKGIKFKGDPEDAFVVIYHAQQPYYNIYTYLWQDSQNYCPLTLDFESAEWRFSPIVDHSDTYELSQPTVLTAEPGILYGYIHHLGSRKARYQSKKWFSFH